jgi:SAM-dependent methyltransferase
MVAVARRQSHAAGLANVRFEIGDAAALRFADATFDGALTRFSLHHIPVPGRVIGELARVVRPGGWIIVGDHVTDDDADAAAWHQEIERLRDPSHWSCLTPARIRTLGARAGLELDYERCLGIAVDFEDWLRRSTAGTQAASLIEACVGDRPADARSFDVFDAGGRRQIGLRYLLTRWRRP